jgi:flavodoxin
MHALVVFESMFGNTEVIARAVAAGLSSRGPVEVLEVSSAPTEIGADVALLVVGGPTHAFGMSRPRTREDALLRASGPLVSPGGGIREWITEASCLVPVPAVAFDTHVKQGWVPGSAANGAKKRLQAKGFIDTVRPRSFYVQGVTGPLVEGETAAARRWGEELAVAFTTSPAEVEPQ